MISLQSGIYIKVAQSSFSGSIPPKFVHKLHHHKQRFEGIDLEKLYQATLTLIPCFLTNFLIAKFLVSNTESLHEELLKIGNFSWPLFSTLMIG